jgi:sulfur carrier protein
MLEFPEPTSCCTPPVISLTVNGEPRRFDAPLKVDALVHALDLGGKRIAVERNGEIVPRGRFRDEWLADGDRIEIVVAVGGG